MYYAQQLNPGHTQMQKTQEALNKRTRFQLVAFNAVSTDRTAKACEEFWQHWLKKGYPLPSHGVDK